jgi:WD40-like Beta Propeller Repeat
MPNIFRTIAQTFCCILICGVLAAQAQKPSPSPTPSPAPTPPLNDIFIVDVTYEKREIKLSAPEKITEWNGYNNQPFFLPDGESLLYTSIRADKQADIYRYQIRTGRRDGVTTRVTETTESEYSPTVTPDKKYFSVVRVEADSTQRLWKFPLAGGKPELVLEKIKPVGYHAWIDQNTLALFILGASGKPSTLQIVDVPTEKAEVIATDIGRTLRLIPHQKPRQNKLSFVQKISAQEWLIKALDLQTRQIATLIKTLPGSEDYAWLPTGLLLMSKDAKLFACNPAKDPAWREIADFKKAGLRAITRIAVSPKGNRIALVAH